MFNLINLLGIKKRTPKENFESMDKLYKEVDEAFCSAKDESNRWLSAFLNAPLYGNQGIEWRAEVQALLEKYCIQIPGVPVIYSNNSSGFSFKKVGETYNYKYLDRNGRPKENSDYDIDFIGLLETVIKDLQRITKNSREYSFIYDPMLEEAKKLRKDFYEQLEKSLPLLDEFYSVTRGRNLNPNRANEISRQYPYIPNMAKCFDEYLESSVSVEALRGKFSAVQLVMYKYAHQEGMLEPRIFNYFEGENRNAEIADLLFSPKNVTAERLTMLAGELSYDCNLRRAVISRNNNSSVLDISEFENLVKVSKDAQATGYIDAVDSIRKTIPIVAKKFGKTPRDLGLEIKDLPVFDKTERKESKVIGLNYTKVEQIENQIVGDTEEKREEGGRGLDD